MMKTMEMMKYMWKGSEMGMGIGMKIYCNTKMQWVCFIHVILNDTNRP